jgi:prepilin-type N-terminal cleavage/methylation domain-containing protein
MLHSELSHERGFTLVELMLAIAIGMVVVGMAMGGVPGMLKVARADGGLAQLAAGVRAARELSVSTRRNVRVTFGTNTVVATRVELCTAPCTPATTVMRTTTLEGRSEFMVTPGLTTDTGDHFMKGTTPAALDLGTLVPAMFTTDGSFIDSNGDVLNATVIIGIPGDPLGARAITIFGPTGAIHLWRWDGRAWVEA